MRRRTISVSMLIALVFLMSPKTAAAHGNPNAPHPHPTPKAAPLPDNELKNAMLIDHINKRPVLVPPGGKQLYKIRGTDIYVEISGEGLVETAKDARTISGPSTYTQVCGIDVRLSGILFAQLRNRANVTYYTGYTLAPARFNWTDMRGTRSTNFFAKWKGLGQFSYPTVRQRFETYGYTQAWGNLEINFYPFGSQTTYYVSRLVINRSGTYCQ